MGKRMPRVDQFDQPFVDLAPLFVRADGRQFAGRNFERQVQVPDVADVDDHAVLRRFVLVGRALLPVRPSAAPVVRLRFECLVPVRKQDGDGSTLGELGVDGELATCDPLTVRRIMTRQGSPLRISRAFASSGVGRRPIVSKKARRTKVASSAAGDGLSRSLRNCSSTRSSMNDARGAAAYTSSGTDCGNGDTTRAITICEENHAVTAPSP